MASDYTKSGQEIILDLIKQDNASASALSLAAITFGNPAVRDNTGGGGNTALTIDAVDGSGYSGSVALDYNRNPVSAFVGAEDLTYALGDATTLVEFLPEINAQLGINLAPSDIVDAPVPTFTGTPNEEHDATITIAAGCLVFTGSLTITITSNDIALSSIITVTSLSGLEVPV